MLKATGGVGFPSSGREMIVVSPFEKLSLLIAILKLIHDFFKK